MDWYKHDTSATQDAKIRKLLIHSERVTGSGVYGYAIYFHCLELIAGDVSASNITFQLEHDSEIIADTLRIRGTGTKSGRDIVEELMLYMIELGLFENNQGNITCLKLLKRLDASMTSNSKLREIIANARNHHDGVMMGSCKRRGEEKRIEEKREEEKRATTRHHKTNQPMNQTTYDTLVAAYGKGVVDDYFERISDYCAAKGKVYRDHAATCRNWLKHDKVEPLRKTGPDEFDRELNEWRRKRGQKDG